MNKARGGLIAALLIAMTAATVCADAPNLLNYQGRLTDPTGNPKNGTFSMQFAVYDAVSGGNQLPSGTPWTETQNVTVTSGVFNVLLGSVAALPTTLFQGGLSDSSGPLRFLQVTVSGEALTPRSRIASAAYSLQGPGCPADMVQAGTICVDKYEASVWSSPIGGTQYGLSSADYPCTTNGQNCTNIFARSVAGLIPSEHIDWFQAQQACANVGKRLLTNAEWQLAATGTPDPGPDNGTTDCNTTAATAVATGSRSSCISRFGAFDMVGNLWEWVADWVQTSTACPGWGGFSNDIMCLAGASTTATTPEALIRGGNFDGRPADGVFAVADFPPFDVDRGYGFRCAR